LRTAFWLGNSRGAHGVEVLGRMLANDPSQKLREQVMFALSQSGEPAGIAAVIDAAKNDKDARVRSRALFWLARGGRLLASRGDCFPGNSGA
jgi:HEAT repeats